VVDTERAYLTIDRIVALFLRKGGSGKNQKNEN
jgi:hypothetical protein